MAEDEKGGNVLPFRRKRKKDPPAASLDGLTRAMGLMAERDVGKVAAKLMAIKLSLAGLANFYLTRAYHDQVVRFRETDQASWQAVIESVSCEPTEVARRPCYYQALVDVWGERILAEQEPPETEPPEPEGSGLRLVE